MDEITPPDQPLPRKYLNSILYLADRMAAVDGNVDPKERRTVNALADAAGMQDFREDSRYRLMSDLRACEALEDSADAKAAALVVISLILKADLEYKDEEHEYFGKIRKMLEHPPISVPTDLQQHKELALKLMDARDAGSA
ncbi:MAG: hypothetical protein O7E56_11095 [SAR324 cluster bacterium]|nr:hypothetical protein [SAR324 cluster bacterium]